MTVDTVGSNGALALPDEMTGLEDFDLARDGAMPRITIDHDTATFECNVVPNKKYETLNAIMLGLVKNRILWRAGDLEEGEKPLCKSVDNVNGNPDFPRFPWAEAGFDWQQFQTVDERGNVNLPCGNCTLKEWGSHPTGQNPYCSQQFVIPLLFDIDEDGANWVPAVFVTQKTGLKPIKAYMTPFVGTKNPLYTTTTLIGLRAEKKGKRQYAVPTYTRGSATAQEYWPEYLQTYMGMRATLMTPPLNVDEDEADVEPQAQTAAQQVPAPQPPAPAPQAPAAPQAPVQQAAPPTPAPVAPSVPPAPTVAEAQPAQAPAAAQEPPTQPSQAPTSPPAPPGARRPGVRRPNAAPAAPTAPAAQAAPAPAGAPAPAAPAPAAVPAAPVVEPAPGGVAAPPSDLPF